MHVDRSCEEPVTGRPSRHTVFPRGSSRRASHLRGTVCNTLLGAHHCCLCRSWRGCTMPMQNNASRSTLIKSVTAKYQCTLLPLKRHKMRGTKYHTVCLGRCAKHHLAGGGSHVAAIRLQRSATFRSVPGHWQVPHISMCRRAWLRFRLRPVSISRSTHCQWLPGGPSSGIRTCCTAVCRMF